MQFPWKRHICQGDSIAKNVFLDSLSVCAKFQVGNKKCTIQPKFRAMPPDYVYIIIADNLLVGSQSERMLPHIQGLSI